MWQAWTNGILGIWLFIAAFLNFGPTGNMWDNLIVGVIVAVAGFTMLKEANWEGWLSGVLGIWLIIAAFIPVLQQNAGNLWNGIIVGILLMVAGFAALAVGHSHHTEIHAH